MHQAFRSPRILPLIVFFFFGFFHPAGALPQILEGIAFPSSPNPVGSGARALGMGGAFIAVADDASAASWNPGGLHQLETPEVSIVGAFFRRNEDNTFGANPEASGFQDAEKGSLNYLSAAYPFNYWGYNMVVSLNYQYLYDFTREYGFSFNSASAAISGTQNIEYEQTGGLSAIGLAYCIQISPKFSLGLTLNVWDDSLYENGWEQKATNSFEGFDDGTPFTYQFNTKYKYAVTGMNANLGFLWRLNKHLTIGGVLKTPFRADLDVASETYYQIDHPDYPDADPVFLKKSEDYTLDMPLSYGAGVAYRFSDSLTASFDVYRTEWKDFKLADEEGNKTSPITGKPCDETDISATYQIRFGAEYIFITNNCLIPLRGGIFYDPYPAEKSPDDFYGFSLGSGLAKGSFVFDIAYQYRFGNNVGESGLEDLDFSQDVKEHTLYSSLIYYF